MSVLIRGMKMPKGCTECRFPYDGRCLWGRKSKIGVTNYYPLIELPPHGRLIDVDALLASDLGGEPFKSVIRRVLMQAPTIIPADKEDE